ncbi:MAG: aminoglycoside phosphotransferase family protein [Legionella sp.]|nr:MAG: aminoglycoside phosphotransferase family protein [Legionella sp.]
MENSEISALLTSVNTYEEFEQLRLNQTDFTAAAREIMQRHHLPDQPLTLFADGCNLVYALGDERVIKIFLPCHQDQFRGDLLVMQHLRDKLSVKTPNIEFSGELCGWPYIVMTQLPGTLLEGLWESLSQNNKIVLIRELGSLIKEVHALDTQGLEAIDCNWPKFIQRQIQGCFAQHQANELPTTLINEIPDYLQSVELPTYSKPVLLTGEYTPMNFLVNQVDGIWHITGLIDFGDAMLGLPQYDLLGPGAFLIQGNKELLKEFLLAYGYTENSFTEKFSQQMTALMLLHQHSHLPRQIRINNWQQQVSSMKDLQELVWGL